MLSPAPAWAHPLGNFTVNTAATIQLAPGLVHVDYAVDMAEIPTQQLASDIDSNDDGRLSQGELSIWAGASADALVENSDLRVDGTAVPLEVTCATARSSPGQGGLPVLRLDARLSGEVPESGRLEYRDGNYADRTGWHEVTAVGVDGIALQDSTVPALSPSDRLRTYPADLLQSPVDVREAILTYGPGTSEATPIASCSGGEPSGGARPGVGGSGFAELVRRSDLTPVVLSLSILLALGFGAVHALSPGHGKTLMAAYLVGAGGRLRQAVAVGAGVAVMHTASVLALGVLVLSLERTFSAERVYPWLGLASGLVALGLGAALLVHRLGSWGDARRGGGEHASETDHVAVSQAHGHDGRPHGDHEHSGGRGDHSHLVPDGAVLSRKGLMALAVAGGILPSPTALVVLLSSVSFQRVAFGLTLIAAFSLGLAGALIAIGVLTIRARDFVSGKLSTTAGRLLPVASAAVIAGVGLLLTVRGIAQL